MKGRLLLVTTLWASGCGSVAPPREAPVELERAAADAAWHAELGRIEASLAARQLDEPALRALSDQLRARRDAS